VTSLQELRRRDRGSTYFSRLNTHRRFSSKARLLPCLPNASNVGRGETFTHAAYQSLIMRRSSRLSRVVSFGAVAAFVSLSACSIFGGVDDANGVVSDDGGDSDAHDSGRRDSGSTRRDSGTDGGSSTQDGGISFLHDDAGHVLGVDGGPLLCDPQPLGSFSGGSYSPPIGPYADVCTATDLDNYVSCVQGTDSTQCAQFLAGGSRISCGACLLTPNSASRHGATIGSDPASSFLNGAGCLAIVFDEGTSSAGCGGQAERASNCEETACDPDFNCAGASGDDIDTCLNNAAAGECVSYQNAANTACAKDAGGADSVCTVSDVTSLTSFLNLFCGSVP
jgi:hypothetical protein